MAIYTYSLTSDEVAAEIPILDASAIGTATEPISTTDLTQWIKDGASKMNSVMGKSGLVPSASLDSDTHAAVAEAVKGYAVSKALAVLGVTGSLYTEARERWESVYHEYSDRPQQLGDDYTDSYTIALDSDDSTDVWDFTGTLKW